MCAVCTQNGNTSLHVAAAEGRLDIVRFLLSSGLDVNLQNKVSTVSVFIIPSTPIHGALCKVS